MRKELPIRFYLATGLLFIGLFFNRSKLAAQAWNASCNGANYCDVGTIVPTTTVQTIPSSSYCSVMGGSGHSNSFNAGTSKFVKLQFAATAGQKYCFALRTYGSGTNNGSGIEIISTACPTGAGYVATSYGGTGAQYSQMRNCLAWTAPATQTYYIQLSGGTCGCNFFGCCGPTGFELETLDFTYATTASGTGSCSCSGGIILPIELLQFRAFQTKNGTKIEWSTASELNNRSFILERSPDAMLFEPVATVAGSGTSHITKHYTAMDEEAGKGITYYRLKQMDFNGEVTSSGIISVTVLDDDKWRGEIYPNPAEESANFELFAATDDKALVELVDLAGRIVYSKQEEILEGSQTIHVPLGDLPKGAYMMRVAMTGSGSLSTCKLIKN